MTVSRKGFGEKIQNYHKFVMYRSIEHLFFSFSVVFCGAMVFAQSCPPAVQDRNYLEEYYQIVDKAGETIPDPIPADTCLEPSKCNVICIYIYIYVHTVLSEFYWYHNLQILDSLKKVVTTNQVIPNRGLLHTLVATY